MFRRAFLVVAALCASAFSANASDPHSKKLLLQAVGASSLDCSFMGGVITDVPNTTVYAGPNCPPLTFTRSGSGATHFDSTGTLQSDAANVPRFDYDPVTHQFLGWLFEEPRVNDLRNSDGAGATIGQPYPPDWGTGATNGLTPVISGIGTENGIPYIEFTLSGTSTGTFFVLLPEVSATQIPAATNSIWASSAYVKFLTATNVTGVEVDVASFDASGTPLTGYTTTVVAPPTGTLATDRVSGVVTVTDATVAFVRQRILVWINSGVSVPAIFRVGGPQLEPGTFVTSLMRTSGSAVARNADIGFATVGRWFNPNGYSLLAEYSIQAQLPSGNFGGVASLDDGTFSNEAVLLYNPFLSANGGGFSRSGGTAVLNMGGPTLLNLVHKSAIAIAPTKASGYLNGALLGTAIGAAPVGVTTLHIGQAATNGVLGVQHLRRLQAYPFTFSDTQGIGATR